MPTHLTDIPTLPFEKVYMPIMGPLPVTYSGNRYNLSCQNDFTV